MRFLTGNINQLVLKLDTYAKTLARTGGRIVEFVNPKYADNTRTKFKSSTRLECMMQDFPRELPDTAKVGFTSINQVRRGHHSEHHTLELHRIHVKVSHSAGLRFL